MKRSLSLSFGCLLIACLVLATSANGYLRAAHDIALTGQSTMVICGQDGVSTVTLDRDGAPVEPSNSICGHCADCFAIVAFDLPASGVALRGADRADPITSPTSEFIPISRLAAKPPRGPPSKVTS